MQARSSFQIDGVLQKILDVLLVNAVRREIAIDLNCILQNRALKWQFKLSL